MPDTQTGQNPDVVETKVRHVRIDNELWEAAQAEAKYRRESVAAVIKRALVAYVENAKKEGR